MPIVILGFKEFGKSAEPSVIYAGNSGDAAMAEVQKASGFVRIGRANIHDMIPVQIPVAKVASQSVEQIEKPIQKTKKP